MEKQIIQQMVLERWINRLEKYMSLEVHFIKK